MKQFFSVVALGLLATLMDSCQDDEYESFVISSSSFHANDPLPPKYTCEGKEFSDDVSPELHWTDGPKGTLSYAIVFKDLTLVGADAATADHAYHWMIWDIPSSVKSLPENLSKDQYPSVMKGAQQVSAGPSGGFAYLGPCPSWLAYCSPAAPLSNDTYSFTIYAFNVKTIALPARDTTISIVHQMDAYFATIAIAKTEIVATSNAKPNSLPFPCPPAN